MIIFRIGSSLRADNLLYYISRLYLGGRLENASAVGEVLRETGQSVIGDTFEKVDFSFENDIIEK